MKQSDVRLWISGDKWLDGKYRYIWSPDGKYKEELVLPGYQRTRIGNGINMWQTRSIDNESPLIEPIDQLLHIPIIPERDTVVSYGRTHVERIGSSESLCQDVKFRESINSVLCFDTKGDTPVRISNENTHFPLDSVEYFDFQEWAGKKYAKNVKAHGKRAEAELQNIKISSLPSLAADFFTPPKDATVWMDCPFARAWELKTKIKPSYPVNARLSHVQGVVQFAVTISETGVPENLRVLQSAGAILNQAAVAAVSQWRYERTTACSEAKGPTETRIEVFFTLN